MKKKRILLLSFLIVQCMVGFTQNQNIPLKYSFKNGTYLYFADQALSRTSPLEGITAIRISRNTGRGFKELTTVTRPENATAFRNISGEESWAQIRTMKKLASDQEVWTYIQQHPKLNDYGVLSFNMAFRRAMGSAYLDNESAGLSANEKWFYRIEFLDAGGKVLRSGEGSIQGGQRTFQLPNIKQRHVFASDSSVFMSWSAPFSGQVEGLILADVYRQRGGKGSYQKMPNSIIANIKGDSINFYCDDVVVPNTLYRYFIIPRDEMSNYASASDTISALSVNFAAMPLLQQVSIVDTLGALKLRWKSLREFPQVIGIEIQRSRDVRGDYVVLDTVTTAHSTYMDTRVFPDVAYFYRLRVLGLKGMERETGYSGYVSGTLKNKIKRPDPPYGLQAAMQNGFVKLSWQSVSDPDLYAYFVYRATNENGPFNVVSPGLTTTEFTDSSKVSGRTQYVYAVKAVSNNSLESEFSNKVSLRQPVVQLPIPPGGLEGHLDNRTILLSWPSTAKLDHNIAGYNIYRRELKAEKGFNNKVSAAAQAPALGFSLLNNSIINSTSFSDTRITNGITYEYAVASVDVFGIESTFSPFIPVAATFPVTLITNSSVRKVTGGVMIEWDAAMGMDAQSISVYRKKAGDTTFQKVSSLKNTDTFFLDRTATARVLYIYEVRGEINKQTVSRSEEKNIKL